jgi:serine O-acetyltransferase
LGDRVGLINAIASRDLRIYTSCDIGQKLPKSTYMGHPVGIVVNSDAEIGKNVQINQNVTIGVRAGSHPRGVPVIKDDVTIFAGAVILGGVTLEEGCTVGANSVVLDDVGSGKTVVGAPAREI